MEGQVMGTFYERQDCNTSRSWSPKTGLVREQGISGLPLWASVGWSGVTGQLSVLVDNGIPLGRMAASSPLPHPTPPHALT